MNLLFSFWIAMCCLQVSRQIEKGRTDVNCGAECLYVIMGGFELPGNSFAELKKDLGPPTPKGYALDTIEKVAREKGFYVERISLSVLSKESDLPKNCLAILHKKEQHFQILKEIGLGFVDIVDTSRGMKRIPKSELMRDYSDSVLIIAKSKPNWRHFIFPYWTIGGVFAMLLVAFSLKFFRRVSPT